jgi:hypothetical protein
MTSSESKEKFNAYWSEMKTRQKKLSVQRIIDEKRSKRNQTFVQKKIMDIMHMDKKATDVVGRVCV